MGEFRQCVRFTASFDGVRLAYGISGRGHPLVRVPTWISHVEHDWQSPVMRHLVVEMASRHKLVNYDCRGVGMSQRDVLDMSFDAWIHDLEAVADAAGLERFGLWGISGAPAVAIAYAARHPERASHLVLCGGFCRGRLRRDAPEAELEKARVMLELIEQGWGTEALAFRQVFTSLMVPGGTAEQWRWFTDMMRRAATPQTALRMLRLWQTLDVSDLARQVRCPTLVLHARHDAVVPYEEGKLMASLIPHAEFVTLDSANHVILEDEPAWPQLRAELRRFLPAPETVENVGPDARFGDLTERECDVLELIAQGLDNEEIAQRLAISPKTVRNHITSIFGKLAATTRAQAIVRARQAGFGAR
ncbi:MAG TPA: alpha/beta fold hydrolase, partial [Gemmatimonadales bacterium]|nr:alpha/beta fold hydrolase [Gemmatimonadales bacterium]